MDAWELLMDSDPQAVARARAEALRRQGAAGAMLLGAGGRRLAPLGARMMDAQGQGEAATNEAMGQRLRMALQERGLAQQQANADRAYGLDAAKFGWQKQTADREYDLGVKKLEADAAKAAAEGDTKRAADIAKAAEELRKQFQGLQTYKNTQTVAETYRKISGTSETGAGDMSLIFGYMKMLDPGSTVREGEYATAANSGNVGDKVISLYNKALTGERLSPDVRQQFRDEAKKILAAQAAGYEDTASGYRRLAQQQGVNPDDVVMDIGLGQLLGGGGAPAASGPKRVASDADYAALPSGTQYVAPDGSVRTKR